MYLRRIEDQLNVSYGKCERSLQGEVNPNFLQESYLRGVRRQLGGDALHDVFDSVALVPQNFFSTRSGYGGRPFES